LLIVNCDDLPTPDPIDPLFGTNRFDSRDHETALGDMVCDSLVWYVNESGKLPDEAHVDFAVQNGGIFEFGLPKGYITSGMIPGMLKQDILSIIELKGSDVILLFDYLAALRLGENAWAQVSEEVNFTIDWTNGTGHNKHLTIQGMEVDTEAVYRMALGDVLIWGKENSHIERAYDAIKHERGTKHTHPIAQDIPNCDAYQTTATVPGAVQAFVASRRQPYIPEIDGRILIEK
jgi:2',3'-cyclic-nucleotide 2'-phosphodiesterase (5'-nucleotidase family)